MKEREESRMVARRVQRARGLLLGHLVGDALGARFEFESAAAIRKYRQARPGEMGLGGALFMAHGQVTDDSELALVTARTLLAHGFDLDALASAYTQWCRSAPLDMDWSTCRAFAPFGVRDAERDAKRIAARSAATWSPLNGCDNGAMMRHPPFAIAGAAWPTADLGLAVRQDAALSHPTAVAQESSVALVVAMACGLRGGSRRAMWQAAYTAAEHAVVRETLWAAQGATAPCCDGAATGKAQVTLHNAFYQLLHASDLSAALRQTVLAGGDTDTNAALTGALLGAHYGESAIPARWRRAVLQCPSNRREAYSVAGVRSLAESLLACALPAPGSRCAARSRWAPFPRRQRPTTVVPRQGLPAA